MIVKGLNVEISQDDVFRQIDCYEDNDLYGEVLEEYREMEPFIYGLCNPVFLMEYGTLPKEFAMEGIPEGAPVLVVLTSIGNGISEYSTRCFKQGDYLKGMLADAMADSALFSLEKRIEPYLREECGIRKMGIRRRLEAPQDIPIEIQKFVLEKTKAMERCGINISSGYMLNPIKSNAALYVLTSDSDIFMYQHNCRNCTNYNCRGRNIPDIPVKVNDGRSEYVILVKEGQSILDVLIERDNDISAVCGGWGRCGKCKIKVTSGYLPKTLEDKACFTEEDLEEGMRLACKAYPKEPLQIALLFSGEETFEVLTDYEQKRQEKNVSDLVGGIERYGIAIDIGTTTIVIMLISLVSGDKISTYTTVNHQRIFGADVISRIMASTQGKKDELQNLIRRDLVHGVHNVVRKAGVEPTLVEEMAITGNTTMVHLLMGYQCDGLGVFPFTPVNIQQVRDTYVNIIGDDFLNAKVYILPGISTFVGGDIVSGLFACDVDAKEEISLLIDLGTNGEIALGNKEKIMVTSTAAGPAFEGGNITFGVGSVEGAIAGVTIDKGNTNIRTIGNKNPIGICGTGVIEAVAELMREKLIDETGCLDDDYFEDGYPLAKNSEGENIFLTQSDIREIQLAKAAIRAGIETLVLKYGVNKEDIAHIYLAGGFGFKLDINKAIQIGMIPSCFQNKMETVGNSSIGGAVKFLLSDKERGRVNQIGKNSLEIDLAADKDFNKFYMDAIYFQEG